MIATTCHCRRRSSVFDQSGSRRRRSARRVSPGDPSCNRSIPVTAGATAPPPTPKSWTPLRDRRSANARCDAQRATRRRKSSADHCAPATTTSVSARLARTRHRVIHAETLFTGTIDGATVYPRVVVKRALELNAAAVILTHNHPSGIAEPSEADRTITLKLSKALALVEIRLLDHLVVTVTHASASRSGVGYDKGSKHSRL